MELKRWNLRIPAPLNHSNPFNWPSNVVCLQFQTSTFCIGPKCACACRLGSRGLSSQSGSSACSCKWPMVSFAFGRIRRPLELNPPPATQGRPPLQGAFLRYRLLPPAFDAGAFSASKRLQQEQDLQELGRTENLGPVVFKLQP